MDDVEGSPGIQVELDLSDPTLLLPMVKLKFLNERSDWMLSKNCAVWLATELLKAVQQIPEKNFFEKAE